MKVEKRTIKEAVDPPTAAERVAARAALAALARPRLTGSRGAREAEAELRRRLEEMGYRVRELPFSMSSWPGRFGVPVAGGLVVVGAIAATAFLVGGRGLAALAPLLGVPALLLLSAGLARTAIAALPWGRIETSNWIAHRPGARPRYLVAAHRDSKSQGVSLAVRVVAIAVVAIGWAGLLLLALVAALHAAWAPVPGMVAAGLFAVAGGAGLVGCWAGNESPGALDNASGLVALLGIARRERGNDDVAFLITDGEELGLAGAWAVAPRLPPLDGVINLDGLDDHGHFYLMERYGWPRRGVAPHLAAALLAAAGALGFQAERRALPVGVMVDHIAFVEAGVPSLTLMRGGRDSLQRAHRPHDNLEHIDGSGASAAAALVSGALAVLRRRSADAAS